MLNSLSYFLGDPQLKRKKEASVLFRPALVERVHVGGPAVAAALFGHKIYF